MPPPAKRRSTCSSAAWGFSGQRWRGTRSSERLEESRAKRPLGKVKKRSTRTRLSRSSRRIWFNPGWVGRGAGRSKADVRRSRQRRSEPSKSRPEDHGAMPGAQNWRLYSTASCLKSYRTAPRFAGVLSSKGASRSLPPWQKNGEAYIPPDQDHSETPRTSFLSCRNRDAVPLHCFRRRLHRTRPTASV